MNPRTQPGPIVVGIDLGRTATEALRWAAAEAEAQNRPLRIVHVLRPPRLVDPYGVAPWAGVDLVEARTAAEQALREAAALAWSIAPATDVSPLLQFGAPAWELLRQASQARLLVVGTRGLCGVRGALTGSVSAQVAIRSSCPTMVIRSSSNHYAARSQRRVVVGVGAAPRRSPALGFAFQAAQERGVGLTVVHAWSPNTPSDLAAVQDDPSAAEYLGLCVMDRTLQPWHGRYPEVPVQVKVVQDDPARALITESPHAALVVVGSQRRRHHPGMLATSPARSLTRYAECPVAVVNDHYLIPDTGMPSTALPNRPHHRLTWRWKGTTHPRAEAS